MGELCPKCKVSREALSAMYAEPRGTDNRELAQTIINNCKECKKFLDNPSISDFKEVKLDFDKLANIVKKGKKEFVVIEAETHKQEGDIAGSKLLKFYRHLSEEISKNYKILNKGFEYSGAKQAKMFFVVENIKEILFIGPNKDDKKNVEAFKKKHKNTFFKSGKVYAKEKFNQKIEDFVKEWKSVNSQKVLEMYIDRLQIKN